MPRKRATRTGAAGGAAEGDGPRLTGAHGLRAPDGGWVSREERERSERPGLGESSFDGRFTGAFLALKAIKVLQDRPGASSCGIGPGFTPLTAHGKA